MKYTLVVLILYTAFDVTNTIADEPLASWLVNVTDDATKRDLELAVPAGWKDCLGFKCADWALSEVRLCKLKERMGQTDACEVVKGYTPIDPSAVPADPLVPLPPKLEAQALSETLDQDIFLSTDETEGMLAEFKAATDKPGEPEGDDDEEDEENMVEEKQAAATTTTGTGSQIFGSKLAAAGSDTKTKAEAKAVAPVSKPVGTVTDTGVDTNKQIFSLQGSPLGKSLRPAQEAQAHAAPATQEAQDKAAGMVMHGASLMQAGGIHELEGKLLKRVKRKLMTSTFLLGKWSNPIYYIFEENFKLERLRDVVRAALSHWSAQTCLEFIEMDSPLQRVSRYIQFDYGFPCGAFIGQHFLLHKHHVALHERCLADIGGTVHEMGHVIGFWHEHQRSDRDEYVIINERNLLHSIDSAYSIINKASTRNKTPYDYSSIMHYFSSANKESGLTVVPKDPFFLQTIGQKTGLSFQDARTANMEYCTVKCPFELPCQRGGYTDPLDCSKCRCPDGFAGRLCRDIAPSKEAECSGTIQLSAGEEYQVSSPGYEEGDAYPEHVECQWAFKAPPGYRLLFMLTGEYFSVYCYPNTYVCYHWLEVRYKTDLALLGPRLCCRGRLSLNIRSEDNEMMVLLRANYTATPALRKGFTATIAVEKDCGQEDGYVRSKDAHPCAPAPVPAEVGAVDLVLLVDATVPKLQWSKVLDFLDDLLRHFHYSPEGDRISIVMFSDTADEVLPFDAVRDKAEVLAEVALMRPSDGKRDVALALTTGTEILDAMPQEGREKVDRVLLLVTADLNNFPKIIMASTLAKKRGYIVTAVSVSSSRAAADEKAVMDVVSDGRAIVIDSYDGFAEIEKDSVIMIRATKPFERSKRSTEEEEETTTTTDPYTEDETTTRDQTTAEGQGIWNDKEY